MPSDSTCTRPGVIKRSGSEQGGGRPGWGWRWGRGAPCVSLGPPAPPSEDRAPTAQSSAGVRIGIAGVCSLVALGKARPLARGVGTGPASTRIPGGPASQGPGLRTPEGAGHWPRANSKQEACLPSPRPRHTRGMAVTLQSSSEEKPHFEMEDGLKFTGKPCKTLGPYCLLSISYTWCLHYVKSSVSSCISRAQGGAAGGRHAGRHRHAVFPLSPTVP